MYQIAGHCTKCGAPYYLPRVWHSILPPQPMPSCNCWNLSKIETATKITIGELNPGEYRFKQKLN